MTRPLRLDRTLAAGAGLVMVAILVRVAILWWRQAHDPLFDHYLNDAELYRDWSLAWIAGRGFGPPDAPYYMPPLYAQVLALVQKVSGTGPWPVVVLQSACGVGTTLGTFTLGRRLYGLGAGFVAGLLLLVFAPVYWYEGWWLPTSLNLFLLVVVSNLALSVHDHRTDRPRVHSVISLSLGLSMGLAIALRPQNAVLALLVVGWSVMGRRRTRQRVLPVALPLVLGIAAVLAPIAVRNLQASGEFVAVSANGGFNFYLGNSPTADGRFDVPPGLPTTVAAQPEASLRLARDRSGQPLDWSGASRYWFEQGVRSRWTDPWGTIQLLGKKLRLVVAWREMENNFVTWWVQRQQGIGRWFLPSLGLLWLLATPSLVAWLRRPSFEQLPLMFLLASTALVCVLFWVSTRNRLPMVIPLAVLSGASLVRPRLWLRRAAVAALVVLSLGVFWPTGDREGPAFLCDVGRVHAAEGDVVRARQSFATALRIQPEYPDALNGIALTYMDSGQPGRAIALLEDLLRKHPDYELARRNLQAIRASIRQP